MNTRKAKLVINSNFKKAPYSTRKGFYPPFNGQIYLYCGEYIKRVINEIFYLIYEAILCM